MLWQRLGKLGLLLCGPVHALAFASSQAWTNVSVVILLSCLCSSCLTNPCLRPMANWVRSSSSSEHAPWGSLALQTWCSSRSRRVNVPTSSPGSCLHLKNCTHSRATGCWPPYRLARVSRIFTSVFRSFTFSHLVDALIQSDLQ